MAITLAGGTYLISFALAAAEPGPEPAVLRDIMVEGDWLGIPSAETIKTYPGARSLVTETDIHESGARSLEDALRLVPGVRVQDETGTGVLSNIGVRGLNPGRSERAMVLVDGIPVALAPYTGTGLSLFPVTMQSIQAIDVARGGVAVRYGPNNVGGVINFITKPVSRDFSATLKESLSIATTLTSTAITRARLSAMPPIPQPKT
jgi:Fe(3+) dicitrate transport protein